jgi:hypothetical protein
MCRKQILAPAVSSELAMSPWLFGYWLDVQIMSPWLFGYWLDVQIFHWNVSRLQDIFNLS